jgi:HEAT repeat protein
VPGPTLPAPRTVPPAVTEEALPTAAAPARQRTPVVRASAARASDPSSGYHLRQLASADERQRLESVRELGRSREATAIDPLAATLAADRSPIVREAAARALGRIGSPAGLAALRHAAGSDPDRDVRRTAGLAAEMIER